MNKNRCLACGHQKTDYPYLITAYVAITWLFALILAYLILQNIIVI